MRISYWSADVCSSDLSRHRADRAAKGLAVAGIAQSLAERTLRQSERDRGIHAALGVEGAQQLAEAVFADDQVLKRHLEIIELDLRKVLTNHGVVARGELEARRVPVVEDTAEPLATGLAGDAGDQQAT